MKAMKLEGSLVGIDPGPRHSAVVVYNPCGEEVLRHVRIFNTMLEPLFVEIMMGDIQAIGIEPIVSYGQQIGNATLQTQLWVGKILMWFEQKLIPPYLIPRKDVLSYFGVVTHGKNRQMTTDAAVRQAIIDRFGGYVKALGHKATKQELRRGIEDNLGPLHGIAEDEWSALAVALTLEAKLIDEAVAV